jgi:hypothetical protein
MTEKRHSGSSLRQPEARAAAQARAGSEDRVSRQLHAIVHLEPGEGVAVNLDDRELFWFLQTAEGIWEAIRAWYEPSGEPLLADSSG